MPANVNETIKWTKTNYVSSQIKAFEMVKYNTDVVLQIVEKVAVVVNMAVEAVSKIKTVDFL